MKIMKVILGAALLVAILGGASIAGLNNNGILSGRYVGSTSALEWFTPNGGSPEKIDVADSYILHFDGKGNFSGNVTASAEGTSSPFALLCTFISNGTYTLNNDGTGTISVETTATSGGCDSEPQTFNIYYSQNGSKECFTQTSVSFTSTSGTTNSLVGSGCASKQ